MSIPPSRNLSNPASPAGGSRDEPPVPVDEQAGGPPPERFQLGAVLTLAGAHLFHDLFSAFLVPLLPLVVDRLGLSLFQAGSLRVFQQGPSLLNPLLGALADRARLLRYFVIAAPAVTGALMCLLGLAPSYGALAVLLLTAGISIASLHVAAPVLVAAHAGPSLGRGTGLFQLAGELARTVGPLVAVQAVTTLGMEGLWRLIPVSFAASAVLWWRIGRGPDPSPRAAHAGALGALLRRHRRLILGVGGILGAQSFMVGALTTFLPIFMVQEGLGLWWGGAALSVFELAGAGGVLAAGWASDRLGRRRILALALLVAPLLMAGMLAVPPAWAPALLFPLGFSCLATAPVLMATVIERVPESRAAANGIYMALTFALRALIVLAVGAMGDALGLRTAFALSAALALIGLFFVRIIPPRES